MGKSCCWRMEQPCGWLYLRTGWRYRKPGYMERCWAFFLVFHVLVCITVITGQIAINTPKLSFLLWEHSAAWSEHGDCKYWDVRRCWRCYSADHKVTGLFWAGFKLARWMPDLAFLLEQGELLVGLGTADQVCCANCIHFCIDSILHPQCGYSSCSAVA